MSVVARRWDRAGTPSDDVAVLELRGHLAIVACDSVLNATMDDFLVDECRRQFGVALELLRAQAFVDSVLRLPAALLI